MLNDASWSATDAQSPWNMLGITNQPALAEHDPWAQAAVAKIAKEGGPNGGKGSGGKNHTGNQSKRKVLAGSRACRDAERAHAVGLGC